ncbi:MAG: S9 family peptidase [Candidatus Nealsonbacteria bacterium]|nr:S9 family peptidase [Candidatus Nealsonbacteria bacterium]
MHHVCRVVLCAFVGLLAASTVALGQGKIAYPKSRRVEHVDVYHGTKVADPYRWLEADVRESNETADWVTRQNEVTFGYLESIPQRDAIRRRLTELWNYERYSAPQKEGGRYYYFKNNGLQNQSTLYTMRSLEDEPRVLIDPNKWSKDGTVALAGAAFSDDGKYIAFCRAEAGSDWKIWRVMEIDTGSSPAGGTGRVLDDEVRWAKFGGASWTKDGKGFFYSRFPTPKPGEAFQALNLNHKLYYHRLGTPQSADVLVYARPDEPEWSFYAEVTEDGRYLVITVAKGTDDKYRIVVRDLAEPYAMPVELITEFENEYSLVGNDGPVLFFQTDLDAPRKRLIAVDLRKPEPEHFREIIPQAAETLLSVSLVADRFVASYLKDVKPQVKIFNMTGKLADEVQFPGIGSASGFGGHRKDKETFYSFSSFATPPSIYRYDMTTGKSTMLRRAEVKFNPDAYTVKQVFYRSKDGTRVPMFISHKKGIKLDGSHPTLLYGYGGFAIPLRPRFSVSRIAWMEMGGIAATANLRGGGEYGEAWHEAGKLANKQNVFDDFIAAAQWLIDNKYTRPEKLAIQGGSNGGLLVGAVMTQRPDLFGACLPAVGVMDMLRFHKFTSGRYWVDDYGSADDAAQFRTLRAYSPYHNLKPGTHYPATLITTADTDDRVVPAHSFKFAAALQHAHTGNAPVLIRIETRAGHGAGKPTTKRIEEIADLWAFLVRNLGMENGSSE